MKNFKTIRVLVILICVLAVIAAFVGFFSTDTTRAIAEVKSVRGETVQLYGKGIYKYDSVGAVAQGMAQDVVTIILGIPLLILSLYKHNTLKGKLLLTGTLGYFLYTYTSYVFIWMLNPLFFVYVSLMSLSFFSFIYAFNEIDQETILQNFSEKLPRKFLGNFQIALGIIISFMWLGRLKPMFSGQPPLGLEHYTTLVIQALDYGFIVPLAIISGLWLKRNKPMGYLLTSIIIIKALTLGTSILAMTIGQVMIGVYVSPIETSIFVIADLFILYCLFVLLKNIKD